MVAIDPSDDSLHRFVVRHFRYDPERRERRPVVVAAYDNEGELIAHLESARDDIERRQRDGGPVGSNEHASGVVWEPGHQSKAAYGRFVQRALRHGVDPSPWLDRSRLPSNMWVTASERDE